MSTKVAVTGMGIVSPLGNSVEAFWESLCRGRDGITPLTNLPAAEDFKYNQAGQVVDFQLPAPFAAEAQTWNLANQFVTAAAHEALCSSGLSGAPRGAIVLSSNFGAADAAEKLFEWQSRKEGEIDPTILNEYSLQNSADHLARLLEIEGPRMVLSLSCSSGCAAIGLGADLVRAGQADFVLAGGFDVLTRFCWSGLSVLRTMTDDKIRPFDRNRKGTLFSEGAAILVLENATRATERNATILAELAGHATGNNAHHMTAPSKEGAGTARVLAAALRNAGCSPADIDHYNAHGTGTRYNDITETEALKAVFAERAADIPITSIKSMTGHLMGAAGAAEAIASVLSIREGIIPPTINFQEADPECDLDYVFNQAREQPVRTVLSNSAGIGGCNAALVLCRAQEGNS